MGGARLCFIGILAAALLGAAAAAADPPPDVVAGRTADLHAAQDLWAQAAVDDYRYRIDLHCFCAPIKAADVVVLNGHPSVTKRPFRALNTVPKLFSEVRRNLGDDGLDVHYDARLGYPHLIANDPSFQIADEESTYTISRFRLLR